MLNNSVESNYSNLIVLEKSQTGFSQKIANQAIQSLNQFSFINIGQWVLLLTLNVICFTFMVFACVWVI
jgi:hypothetical protein